jgi:anti-anti-sigma factor
MSEPLSVFGAFNSLSLGVFLEEIPARSAAHVLSVAVTGYVETGNAGRFQDALIQYVSERPDVRRLCLDVSLISYVSSMGIGALAAVHQRMAERNGSIVLHRASPRLKELFAQLGFSEIFSLSDAACGDEGGDAGSRAVFPRALACPKCESPLRVSKPGRFRCQSCGSIFSVDLTGAAN